METFMYLLQMLFLISGFWGMGTPLTSFNRISTRTSLFPSYPPSNPCSVFWAELRMSLMGRSL